MHAYATLFVLLISSRLVVQSLAQCPPGEFSAPGSNACTKCTACMLNERIITKCSGRQDTECAVCSPCADKSHHVWPNSMCNGFEESTGNPPCYACKGVTTCGTTEAEGRDFVMLYKCMSGEISYDTTMCMRFQAYKDPSRFACKAGEYQRTFVELQSSSSSSMFFQGDVKLNRENSFVSDLQLGGTLRIFKTLGASFPFSAVSEGSASAASSQSNSSNAPAAVAAFDMSLKTFDPYLRVYSFLVKIAVPSGNALTVSQTEFIHPMSSSDNLDISGVRGTARLIASGVWSFDGSAFFVVWMDGTISKVVVTPWSERTFVANWSPAPTMGSPNVWKVPLWSARHPSAKPFDALITHQCAAVPTLPASASRLVSASRQIQLVCMYNFLGSNALFGTYLVRVMGDGVRLEVNSLLHTTNTSSSSLFYDINFNTIYVTTYQNTSSFQGGKRVLKVRLSSSYNFKSELSSTKSVLSEPLRSALEPTHWIMPSSYSASSSSNSPQLVLSYPASYPEGMSLDGAAVDPLTGDLFFYTQTAAPAAFQSQVRLLYYIPAEMMSSDGTGVDASSGERMAIPILVEDPLRSAYAGRLYRSISVLYSTQSYAELVFTVQDGLYARYAWLSMAFWPLAECASCPAGLTSNAGSTNVDQCSCLENFYLDLAGMKCVPVRASCGANEYVFSTNTRTSDKICQACPACPVGTYRNPLFCRPDAGLDFSVVERCIPCSRCAPGTYIDPAKCSGRGTADIDRARDCVACRTCAVMQTIVQRCPGSTTYDTQRCQECTAKCPYSMYINPRVERCSGLTTGSATDPFDKVTECMQCAGCARFVISQLLFVFMPSHLG